MAFDIGRNGRIKRQLTKENLIKLLDLGLTNSEIAIRLRVSSGTISRYIKKYDIKRDSKNERL